MNIRSMAFLSRALRIESRSGASYLRRALLGGVLLVALMIAHDQMSWRSASGLWFFNALAWINLVVFTFLGVGFFAASITEEKEDQTMGLLRMTGMPGIAILAGKGMDRLYATLIMFACQIPFMMLCITLGGVSIAQVIAAIVCIAAHIFAACSVAMFCSVVFSRTAIASIVAIVLCIAYMLLPPVFYIADQIMMDFAGRSGPPVPTTVAITAATALEETLAVVRLSQIMTTGFNQGPIQSQVVSNSIVGIVFLLLAWWAYGPFCRDAQESGPASARTDKSKAPKRRRRRAWKHAFVWKGFYFTTGGKNAIALKMIGYPIILTGLTLLFSLDSYRWDIEDTGNVIMTTMLVLLAAEAMIIASRIFRDELKWQTLATIILSPLDIQRISYQVIAGALITLLPGIGYFALGAALSIEDFGEVVEELFFDNYGMGWYLLMVFIALLHAIAWLSLILKWGAIPIAVFAMFAAQFILIWIFSSADEGILVLLGMAMIAATIAFHVDIGHRLKTAAAAS